MTHSNAFARALHITPVLISLSIGGCALTPSIPANVILDDAHTVGDSLAFSRDSRRLASAGTEGTIRLWRIPDAVALTKWQAHEGPVQGLAFLENDRVLLSAGWDGTLAKWTTDGHRLARQDGRTGITDMAHDESSDVLVTGHTDGHVRRWRLSDLTLLQEWRPHRGEVRAVAFHPSTRRIASSATRVFLWQIDEPPRELARAPSDARTLAFSPDGRWLTGGGWFNLFQWHVGDGTVTVLPTEHRGIIPSIEYSADGRTLASISRQTDSSIYFLDPQTGAVQRRFQPHDLCGVRVRLSPDGGYLASTSDDASVRLWDLRNPLPEQTGYYRNWAAP